MKRRRDPSMEAPYNTPNLKRSFQGNPVSGLTHPLTKPSKRCSSQAFPTDPYVYHPTPPVPTYSNHTVMVDQARLAERRMYEKAIEKMEMERSVYLKELHYLQLAQTRGGPAYPPYVS
jgi:hypothetical protein